MEKKGCNGVVDPLANYWGLSLFPQTCAVFPSNPHDPEHDLHAIHNHLRSMALRSPNKLLEQTKSILDGNPQLFNSRISTDPAAAASDFVAEEAQIKRRPALGLKRGCFSLKPAKNPSIENLLPTLDLDKLKDPVEFFLAHQRLENAKREIQKQMGGVPLQPNHDCASTKPRQRRPGLSGNDQRPVRYRHRYPRATFQNSDDVPSSQQTIGSDGLDPVSKNTDKDGASLRKLENEVTDSSAIEENKLNEILDRLLHCNPEDLEGDGAMTLLQERLQIKPIVVEKLSIPGFPDNQVIDLKSVQGNLSKPRRALSNIDNLLKGMNSKTPLKLDVGWPLLQLASPPPPRSPFASLSSLQKHLSQSKPSLDPFSAHEIDHLTTRNSSCTHTVNQELNLVSSGKLPTELNVNIIEDVNAISKTSSVVDSVRNCTSNSRISKDDDSGKSPDKPNVVNGTSSVEDTVRNCAFASQKSTEDNSGEPMYDANTNEYHVDMDMDVDIISGGMSKKDMDDTVGRPDFEANGPRELEDITQAEIMNALPASVAMDDSDLTSVNPQAYQSSPAGFQASSTDKGAGRSKDSQEQCQQVQEKTDGSFVPVNGERRTKFRSKKEPKDKRFSQRQSLAAAGTSWNSGLRRSTRIRTRPLEYWKGERLVYGRVHESLATVIGVKRMSPGSDGKPTLKVKSFVSDKYKELLDLASLY